MTKVLNPFAFMLERREDRFYEIKTKPVYKNGEYQVFKYPESGRDHKWFVTCRKNLIVTETTGIPKNLIEALVAGKEPADYSKYHYRRMLDNYQYALRCAQNVGFKVEDIQM